MIEVDRQEKKLKSDTDQLKETVELEEDTDDDQVCCSGPSGPFFKADGSKGSYEGNRGRDFGLAGGGSGMYTTAWYFWVPPIGIRNHRPIQGIRSGEKHGCVDERDSGQGEGSACPKKRWDGEQLQDERRRVKNQFPIKIRRMNRSLGRRCELESCREQETKSNRAAAEVGSVVFALVFYVSRGELE